MCGIVGAIANEADIEGKYIGQIDIHETYSTVDLPEGMPNDVFKLLKKTRVRQRPLEIERINDTQTKQNHKTKPKKNKKRATS